MGADCKTQNRAHDKIHFVIMSHKKNYLHSHSALEREKGIPKHKVIIDIEFGNLFAVKQLVRFNKEDYYLVDTYTFYQRGGVFQNLLK